MSTFRYVLALVVGAAIFIAGIVITCMNTAYVPDRLLFSAVSYAVASLVINLIWFDGPVVSIGSFCFSICSTIVGFALSLFGTIIGWIILILIGSFLLSAIVAVIGISILAIAVVSMVMFPINVFRYAGDLY